jgi:hypothetical protein
MYNRELDFIDYVPMDKLPYFRLFEQEIYIGWSDTVKAWCFDLVENKNDWDLSLLNEGPKTFSTPFSDLMPIEDVMEYIEAIYPNAIVLLREDCWD